MKKLLFSAISGLLAILATPLFATNTPMVFDFGGTGSGNTYSGSLISGYTNQYSSFSDTVGGVTATITAWSTVDNTAGSKFSSSASVIGQYSGGNGLGVCSPADGTIAACNGTAPQHQIDNTGAFEFLLIQFSSAVDLNSVLLKNFSSTVDMDLTYWTSTSSTALTTGTDGPGSLPAGFSGPTSIDCGGSGQPACVAGGLTDTFTVNKTGVKSLLVGTSSTNADGIADAFKLSQVSATLSNPTATPEPATFGMIGLALLGLGGTQWRKRRNAQAKV